MRVVARLTALFEVLGVSPLACGQPLVITNALDLPPPAATTVPVPGMTDTVVIALSGTKISQGLSREHPLANAQATRRICLLYTSDAADE